MNKMGYSTMMYRNLVYKEYIDIELDMTKDYIQEFYRSVEKNKLHKNGPLIIVYTQIMKDERVNILFYLPVDKPFKGKETLKVRSYLYIDQMLHARMIGNDYEQEEVKALNEIEEHAKENHLRKIPPYYHIINEINDYYWVDIKVKVMETRG